MKTIELRTHAEALVPTIMKHDNSWIVGTCHDALAAHALVEAMGRLREDGLIGEFTCETATDFIMQLACEILAEYLGEKS